MSIAWLTFQNRIQYASTCISFFLNSFLIYLISVYSPKTVGTYKYLMIYISFFQMFYSIMDNISLPVYHTVSSVIVVFKDIHEEGYFPPSLHYWLLVLYTGCYGFCMGIFGIHFLYRYCAIYGHSKFLETFEGCKILMWLLIPPVFAFIWAITVGTFFAPTPESAREIQKSIWESYELKLDQIVYITAYIWPRSPGTGRKYLNLNAMLMTSFWAIFYFGSRCYYKIQEHIKMTTTISKLSKNLHRQLFTALVMQTAIPIMLLHIPVSGLFIFPILDSDMGVFSGFVTITIAMYPAIDPLPTMFVIENYRKAILDLVLCRKGNQVGVEQHSSFAEGSMTAMTTLP